MTSEEERHLKATEGVAAAVLARGDTYLTQREQLLDLLVEIKNHAAWHARCGALYGRVTEILGNFNKI